MRLKIPCLSIHQASERVLSIRVTWWIAVDAANRIFTRPCRDGAGPETGFSGIDKGRDQVVVLSAFCSLMNVHAAKIPCLSSIRRAKESFRSE